MLRTPPVVLSGPLRAAHTRAGHVAAFVEERSPGSPPRMIPRSPLRSSARRRLEEQKRLPSGSAAPLLRLAEQAPAQVDSALSQLVQTGGLNRGHRGGCNAERATASGACLPSARRLAAATGGGLLL